MFAPVDFALNLEYLLLSPKLLAQQLRAHHDLLVLLHFDLPIDLLLLLAVFKFQLSELLCSHDLHLLDLLLLVIERLLALIPVLELFKPHSIGLVDHLLRNLHLLHALVVLVDHQLDKVLLFFL